MQSSEHLIDGDFKEDLLSLKCSMRRFGCQLLKCSEVDRVFETEVCGELYQIEHDL